MKILATQYPSGLVKCVIDYTSVYTSVNYIIGKGHSIKEALGDLVIQKVSLEKQTVEHVSEAQFEELVDKCEKLKYKS